MKIPSTRTLALIIGILVMMSLAFAVPSCMNQRRNAAAEARLNKGQTGAVLESGMDASNTQATISINDMSASDLDRTNAEDIRNAEGSNTVVPAGVNDAWMRAICQRKANLDRAECRMFRPGK